MVKTILCVCDSSYQEVVESVTHNLRNMGLSFETVYQTNLPDAKEALNHQAFNGVFLYDLQIPTGEKYYPHPKYLDYGSDRLSFEACSPGLELLDYCHEMKKPIVACSPTSVPGIRERAEKLGNLDTLLAFPLNLNELRAQFKEKFGL